LKIPVERVGKADSELLVKGAGAKVSRDADRSWEEVAWGPSSAVGVADAGSSSRSGKMSSESDTEGSGSATALKPS